ncbi:MAG: polymer-forming cytoskeletal protein [Deltaproteobacteria bacterium]|jgi:cytoskeletal protein CcmA (bactofilin family)|nr:MAG: polymer-forming cytoskeletal protein [Deltaproteobacteria bacterium]
MFGRSSTRLETVIGSDSTIRGELTIQGTVRVDGNVEGDIRADWVIVGETGKVRGNVQARAMVVGGKVEGNIDASEIVELKDKAQVFGEICAAKLAMSEGALFDGQSSMKQKKETSGGQEKRVTPLTASRTAS